MTSPPSLKASRVNLTSFISCFEVHKRDNIIFMARIFGHSKFLITLNKLKSAVTNYSKSMKISCRAVSNYSKFERSVSVSIITANVRDSNFTDCLLSLINSLHFHKTLLTFPDCNSQTH